MLILLKILLFSLIYTSCGVKVTNEKDHKRKLPSNIMAVPQLKLSVKGVNKKDTFKFLSKEQKYLEDSTKHFKSSSFYSTFQEVKLDQFNTLEVNDESTQSFNIHFKIQNSQPVCFIRFRLYNGEYFFERSVYRDEIRNKLFTLENLSSTKKLDYKILDFKYCDHHQSLLEFLEESYKSFYEVTILNQNSSQSYMVEQNTNLRDFILSIDPDAKINEHNKLERFLGENNFRRLSPLNKHLDSHGFWLSTGLIKDNYNYAPKAGSHITLTYMGMNKIRESLSQVVSFKANMNETIEIKDRSKYYLKDIKIQGTSKQFYKSKRHVRVKYFKIMGSLEMCSAYVHEAKTKKVNINIDKNENKEAFSQFFEHPYPDRFIFRPVKRILKIGFTNKNCKNNLIRMNKKWYPIKLENKSFQDIMDIKLILTKELIVL
jgi:hypothetical protein